VNTLVYITERKEAERSAQRLVAIVESSDDAILSKSLDGIITTWNPGAERLPKPSEIANLRPPLPD
jgi:PAS domain-containing protein